MTSESLTPWARENSRLYADCSVYRILKEKWINEQQGNSGEFFVVEVADWAVTLALTDTGKCVLIKQFRFGAGDFTWELPAGMVDPGEDPITAAERELFEESGYRGRDSLLLGSIYPNPAIQRNKCHFVLSRVTEPEGEGAPDEHEAFEVIELPLETVYEWSLDGRISHSIVLTGLYILKAYLAGELQTLKTPGSRD